MKAASLSEIKKTLVTLDAKEVLELCMHLAKYKKESKELLTYLLFEAQDEQGYVESIKREMDEQFETVPKSSVYLIKKSLRKILRLVNKQIKFSGNKESEVALRIYFCSKIKKAGIQLHASILLVNLYQQQLKKIDANLAKLPEDLQFDYERDFEDVSTLL